MSHIVSLIKKIYHWLPSKPILWQSLIYSIGYLIWGRDKNFITPTPALRSSDRLFIFGSGPSLQKLTTEQIKEINAHDCMAFNYSILFEGVDWDYYIIREFQAGQIDVLGFQFPWFINPSVHRKLGNAIAANCGETTSFIVNIDWKSGAAKHFTHRYVSKSANKIAYKNKIDRRVDWPPSETMWRIPHGQATLVDAINIAYILGYQDIVLVGVDLNDATYFGEFEERFDAVEWDPQLVPHKTRDYVVPLLAKWSRFLSGKGKALRVANPKSAAAAVLDVYEFDCRD